MGGEAGMGEAGVPGTGGTAGGGGTAGTGGTNGVGGAGAGGGAGTAGVGGVAGSAGAAGGAGTSGAAGSSGSAGASGAAGSGGAGNCVTGSVRVDYAPGSTNGQIEYDINVVNVSSTPIPVKNIDVRYYFTQENVGTTLVPNTTVNQLQNPFDAAGGGTLTTTYAAFTPATATADHYFATTFGGSASLVQNQYVTFKTYFQPANQTQTNDYSFGTQTSNTTWNKIVVFVNGVQQWGCTP
jgi:hypothetical protein